MKTHNQIIPVEKALTPFIILLVFLWIIWASAIAVSSKIIYLFWINFSASVIVYAFSFFIIDCIDEIYWEKITKKIFFVLLWGTIFISLIYNLVVALPPSIMFENQIAFEKVFWVSEKIAIAGFLAFITSQFLNIKLFNFFRKITNWKHLWLRNIFSTLISTFFDSFIFITIVFFWIPNIYSLIMGEYMIKILVALIDTIFIYMFVNYVRKKLKL